MLRLVLVFRLVLRVVLREAWGRTWLVLVTGQWLPLNLTPEIFSDYQTLLTFLQEGSNIGSVTLKESEHGPTKNVRRRCNGNAYLAEAAKRNTGLQSSGGRCQYVHPSTVGF